jgi:hypothetical protein
LVIDELGPLEFNQGKGLVSALTLIDAQRYNLSFVVIRPSLLQLAKTRWPWAMTFNVPDHRSISAGDK